MGKRHSTEWDTKDILIIRLRDRIRFLEGKPTSTGAETQLAMGKGTVNLMTRSGAGTIGVLPGTIHANTGEDAYAGKAFIFAKARQRGQAKQERAETRALKEADNRRTAEVQNSSQPQSRRAAQTSRTWRKRPQDHYGPGLQRSQSSSSMTGAYYTPIGAGIGGRLLSSSTPASPGGASTGGELRSGAKRSVGSLIYPGCVQAEEI